MLQITQPSQYSDAKLLYRFVVSIKRIERINEVADKNSEPLINGVVDPGGVDADPTFEKKVNPVRPSKKTGPELMKFTYLNPDQTIKGNRIWLQPSKSTRVRIRDPALICHYIIPLFRQKLDEYGRNQK